MATATKRTKTEGIQHISDHPGYQAACDKAAELNARRTALQRREDEIEEQLRGLPTGRSLRDAQAAALLGAGNAIADASALRTELAKVEGELEIVTRAIELHQSSTMQTAQRDAERSVREHYAAEHRERCEALLECAEQRLSLLNEMVELENDINVPYGAPWIVPYSLSLDGEKPNFDKLKFYVDELKTALKR